MALSMKGACLCALTKIHKRSFSTTVRCLAGASWRMKRGLPRSGNEYGPLTDLPDWSYADGRPGHLTVGQLRRKEEQRKHAERVMRLHSELTYAKQRHAKKMLDAEEIKHKLSSSKLKPKQKS